MINVSAAWMQSLYNDHRNYLVHLKITLQDNTVLNLTNENIWGGSLSVDDAVSSDNEFQIGAAIINKMSVTINNIYGDYDPYDFYGARVELKIGLIIDGEEEKINKGKYIVNNATYNGQLIALECYDYMYFFDVSYSTSNQIFPATIDDIVRNCCTDVGVSLNTYNFPHKNYLITTPPEKEKTTYREIISWCAQICGCFARCNTNGQLEFKWYDFDTLDQTAHSFLNGGIFDEDTPYSTGNTADGGKFNPWNLGDVYDGGAFNWNTTVHTITSLYSLNVSVDDVIITRIQAIVKAEDTQNQAESEKAYNIGAAGYTVEIRNNPFITESNVEEILSWLGTQIIGVKFRKASISHASDPSIEAGDSAVVIDRKNTIYPIIISRTTFSTGGSQNSISAAQNPLRNSAARFSAETKNYVDLRQRIQNERTTRQQIEAQLALDIANSNGMYKTETTEGGATKYYLHNKPQLSDSAIRILFSDVGITVTANGLDANPTWYGLRVNGDLISRILTATGVNADWIDTGALVVRDNKNNLVFKADISNHTVYVKGYATFSDLSGNGTTTINGANIKTGTISAARLELTDYAKFTDLSGNGTTTINGSNITTGTINADLIKAGTLQSQDSARYPNFSINLSDGTITIKHGSINLGNNNFIVDDDGNVTIKKGSITIGTNENFKVTSNGSVTMKNATITGYLTPDDVGNSGNTIISGNRIQTGTISAARLELTDYAKFTDLSGNGTTTINGANIKTGTISAARLELKDYAKFTDLSGDGTTTINGANIKTGTINADLITAGTLKSKGTSPNFSLILSTGELTMKNGSINIGNKFIVDKDGNVTMKGTVTINGASGSSGYVTATSLSDSLSYYPTKKALKTSNGTEIHGANITTGTISASHLDLSGVATIDSLSKGTTTISGGCIQTGKIQSTEKDGNTPYASIDLTTGSIVFKKGTIKIGNNSEFYVSTSGDLTAKTARITSNTSDRYSVNIESGVVNFQYNGSRFAYIESYYTTGSTYSSLMLNCTRGRMSQIELSAASYAEFGLCGDGDTYLKSTDFTMNGDTLFVGDVTVRGDFLVDTQYGKKNKIVNTKDYSRREMYSYETTSPLFGDVGSGIISEDGFCYIQIDPIFHQTIFDNNYQVFLQKCSEGDCYIFKKTGNYFIVKGTPFLKFDWEIKCRQINFENARLDDNNLTKIKSRNEIKYDIESANYLNELKKERMYI